MKTKKKYTTIYVVSSHYEYGDHLTVGAWRERGHALDAATDYIVERLHLRDDIGRAFANDWNHAKMLDSITYDKNGKLVFAKPESDIRAYIRDALAGDGCYIIDKINSKIDLFRFDIDECDIED